MMPAANLHVNGFSVGINKKYRVESLIFCEKKEVITNVINLRIFG